MDQIQPESEWLLGTAMQVETTGRREPYWRAVDAALLILEELDTMPGANTPVRLATVIGIVLDAIHETVGGRLP